MRDFRSLLFLTLLVLISVPMAAQQPPQRDPQGVVILAQTLSALGGAGTRQALSDTIARGTITTESMGGPKTKSLVIKTKGLDRVRYELSDGSSTFVYVLNGDQGWYTHGSQIRRVSHSESSRADISHIPILSRLLGLLSPDTKVQYVGLVAFRQSTAYQIAIIDQSLTSKLNPQTRERDTTFIFVDPQTFLPEAIRYQRISDSVSHKVEIEEYQFSNFRRVGVLLTPFTILRLNDGLSVAQISLSDVESNTGIQDSEFQATVRE